MICPVLRDGQNSGSDHLYKTVNVLTRALRQSPLMENRRRQGNALAMTNIAYIM